MTGAKRLIAVIDDDESVRESLPDLLRAFGFEVEPFESARDFLASDCMARADCLVVDVAMPFMTGPELQQELGRRGASTPIVFITAQADTKLRPRLMAAGAAECLFKPFSQAALAKALKAALGPSEQTLFSRPGGGYDET
jgi:FixJ family two-component response regulator